MNRLKKVSALLLALMLLSACGQEIDENIVIENNATSLVTAGEDEFEISGQSVTMNGLTLAEDIGASEEKIVVLGNKVYFNTDEGTKYISTKNGKIKKFGNGKVIYGKGEWLFYENIDLYMVNVVDGKQKLLNQRDLKKNPLEFKEETDTKIIFTDGEKDYAMKIGGTTLTETE